MPRTEDDFDRLLPTTDAEADAALEEAATSGNEVDPELLERLQQFKTDPDLRPAPPSVMAYVPPTVLPARATQAGTAPWAPAKVQVATGPDPRDGPTLPSAKRHDGVTVGVRGHKRKPLAGFPPARSLVIAFLVVALGPVLLITVLFVKPLLKHDVPPAVTGAASSAAPLPSAGSAWVTPSATPASSARVPSAASVERVAPEAPSVPAASTSAPSTTSAPSSARPTGALPRRPDPNNAPYEEPAPPPSTLPAAPSVAVPSPAPPTAPAPSVAVPSPALPSVGVPPPAAPAKNPWF